MPFSQLDSGPGSAFALQETPTTDGRVLGSHGKGVESIRHIPCVAVQGRLDFVTPVRTAYDLHRAWPEMELRVVPVSGVSHVINAMADSAKEIATRAVCGSS